MTRAVRSKALTDSQRLESVTLITEHEHQGRKHPAGQVLKVHPVVARWLRQAGVVESQPEKE